MLPLTIALFLFLFPLAYSPGPGNMMFAASSARFGFRATLPANLGYHLATWGVTAAIGFGFLQTLERFPQIFTALSLCGTAYILWLAWKLFRAGAPENAHSARPPSFKDGVVLLLLNPKAFVIIALMFTQFLDPSTANKTLTILWITTVFTLNNLIAFSAWALLGEKISTLFTDPHSARALNTAFAALLGATALWMFFH